MLSFVHLQHKIEYIEIWTESGQDYSSQIRFWTLNSSLGNPSIRKDYNKIKTWESIETYHIFI